MMRYPRLHSRSGARRYRPRNPRCRCTVYSPTRRRYRGIGIGPGRIRTATFDHSHSVHGLLMAARGGYLAQHGSSLRPDAPLLALFCRSIRTTRGRRRTRTTTESWHENVFNGDTKNIWHEVEVRDYAMKWSGSGGREFRLKGTRVREQVEWEGEGVVAKSLWSPAMLLIIASMRRNASAEAARDASGHEYGRRAGRQTGKQSKKAAGQ